MIGLETGEARVEIAPAAGGSIMRYAFRGRDVLRPGVPDARDPLTSSCFPLVPFANRIANGRFDWQGHTIHLPRNFGDHPHTLHGHGWQAQWRTVLQTRTRATLRYDHAAGDWPWPYTAEQTFELRGGALHLRLSVSNTGDVSMPVSLGLHPYFMRRGGTRITASVGGVWLSDETQLPTRVAAPSYFLDLANGASMLNAPFVDHCHTGWDGEALIEQPDDGIRIQLSAAATPFLHIFTPPGESYFCAEPVTAMPNAINRGDRATGLCNLAPSETFASAMMLMPEEIR